MKYIYYIKFKVKIRNESWSTKIANLKIKRKTNNDKHIKFLNNKQKFEINLKI